MFTGGKKKFTLLLKSDFRKVVFINGDRAITMINLAKYTVRFGSCAVKVHLSNECGRTGQAFRVLC